MNAVAPAHRLLPGLADPTFDSQLVFRAVLEAFSHPGRTVNLPIELEAPWPLDPATAAFLLSMADLETPLWLQEPSSEIAEYLRFHCGAPIAEDPRQARFAVATDPQSMPDLGRYYPGEPEYPDRSTTVIVQLQHTDRGAAVTLRGPGIRTTSVLDLANLKAEFWAQWKLNDALFPCGVDVLFTCGNTFCALPRTTKAEV